MADEPDVDLTKTDPPPLPPDASVPTSLPGVASTPPRDPLDGVDPKLQEGMASLARSKVAGDESVMEAERGLLNKDRQRLEQQYNATGIEPGEFRKWDADAELSKYRTDPLSKFGSLGSVFGMLASAFTHHPMQNALESSAAAMNAINAGDKEAYDRAHEGWKENMNLVFKRHELEQQRFNDAVTLMHTDMAVGQAQLRENAVRFDDRKMLAMIDAGMIPEIVEYKAKEADTAMKMRIAYDEINKRGVVNAFTDRLSEQAEKQYKNDPTQLAGARLHIEQLKGFLKSDDVDTQALGNWMAGYMREHALELPPQEELQKKIAEFAQAKKAPTSLNATEAKAVQARASQIESETGGASGSGMMQAVQELEASRRNARTGGSGAPRPGSINEDRTKMDAAIRAEHPDWGDDKVIEERNRRLKESSTTLTGNEKKKVEERIDKFHHSDEIIDKTLHVLETHPGAAGIAGKVMRVEERVSNILGTKNTDRVQMMRDIELLRGWGKELLFSSNSKLKKEAERVDSIVGGTSAGDTGPNTIRALKDLKRLYDQMRAEDEARLTGTWKPSGSEGAPTAPKPAANIKAPWASDPIVK